MIRDIIKDKDYFEEIIKRDYSRLNKRIKKIEEGQIKIERINIVKDGMSGTYKNIILAHYSLGDNMNSREVISDYINAVNLMEETWSPKRWNMLASDSTPLNQYTFSGFLDFSRMLSLGILLDIPQEYLLKLVKFIDGDKVKDFLLEFLIKYFSPNRETIEQESYVEFFHINERYGVLKEIINETDKVIAQKKLKHFLETKWYQSFKDTPLYNQHNNPHNIYVGYWCFQAAAITKIMGLDDSTYRDNQYYPKDIL